MIKPYSNTKVSKIPLDLFVYNFLKNKKINIGGWKLTYNDMSNELVWEKGYLEIFSTPFWDGDDKLCLMMIKGTEYQVLEEIDIYRWSRSIKENKVSVYKFIEWYLNFMNKKLKCLDV